MTKKEKSKPNPFAQALYPDEEILWFYTPFLKPFRTHLKHSMLTIFGGIALMSMFPAMLSLAVTHNETVIDTIKDWIAVFMACSFVLTLFSLPAQVFLYGVSWWTYPSLSLAYAITNKRLLRYEMNKINYLPLEEMHDLQLRGDETIAFGESLTEWRHVEGAAEVISMIVDAREDHLKNLAHDQAGDAEIIDLEEMIELENRGLMQQERAR